MGNITIDEDQLLTGLLVNFDQGMKLGIMYGAYPRYNINTEKKATRLAELTIKTLKQKNNEQRQSKNDN